MIGNGRPSAHKARPFNIVVSHILSARNIWSHQRLTHPFVAQSSSAAPPRPPSPAASATARPRPTPAHQHGPATASAARPPRRPERAHLVLQLLHDADMPHAPLAMYCRHRLGAIALAHRRMLQLHANSALARHIQHFLHHLPALVRLRDHQPRHAPPRPHASPTPPAARREGYETGAPPAESPSEANKLRNAARPHARTTFPTRPPWS